MISCRNVKNNRLEIIGRMIDRESDVRWRKKRKIKLDKKGTYNTCKGSKSYGKSQKEANRVKKGNKASTGKKDQLFEYVTPIKCWHN